MTCPNCKTVTRSDYCEHCGFDLRSEGQRTMFDGGCGFVILGILAGIGAGLLFSFWTATHMLIMHDGPGERFPAEACRTDYFIAVTAVLLSIVAVGAILPAGRKLLGEDRSARFDQFAVAFGLTLFCPFLPCNLILISLTLSSGACPPLNHA